MHDNATRTMKLVKKILVQVTVSHWKHNPVTNANYFDTSQGITEKLYLDSCIKSVHTTGAS